MPRSDSAKPRVLAISSGGGHWVQLLRLVPAFVDADVTFVTVREGYRTDVGSARFRTVPDASRWDRLALLRTACSVLRVLAAERPDVVISTGAAPGFFAILFGKFIGARTIWIDSIANVDALSMSGIRVRRFADLWLTQWPHLGAAQGPVYRGSVL
jgi:UDP-N-acetylglucosamine:LPS N-acetylglucosamine transferase